MIAAERLQQIIEILRTEHVVSTKRLSEILGVSSMTARRDLLKLETMGICTRTHGGAIAVGRSVVQDTPYDERQLLYVMEKRAIGRVAAQMVEEGETIALDSGTTTARMAKVLRDKRNITVVTNSVLVLLELSDCSEIRVISTAGTLSRAMFEDPGSSDPCLVGPLAENTMRLFRPTKAFMGTTGIDLTDGLSNSVMDQATMKRTMMEVSADVILLADHSKFGHVASSIVGPITLINRIITDTGMHPDFERELQDVGIEVIKVEPVE